MGNYIKEYTIQLMVLKEERNILIRQVEQIENSIREYERILHDEMVAEGEI